MASFSSRSSSTTVGSVESPSRVGQVFSLAEDFVVDTLLGPATSIGGIGTEGVSRTVVWTLIFHVRASPLYRRDSLFICEKVILEKKGRSCHLFYFYFKGKIKQERKTLKCDSIIF